MFFSKTKTVTTTTVTEEQASGKREPAPSVAKSTTTQTTVHEVEMTTREAVERLVGPIADGDKATLYATLIDRDGYSPFYSSLHCPADKRVKFQFTVTRELAR